MKEIGLVVSIKENQAFVKIDRKSACGSCKGCGLGQSDDPSITISALNSIQAHEGDLVEVDMETTDVLKAAFVMYTIPLIALVAGVLIMNYAGPLFGVQSDLLSIISGLVLMILSLLVIKLNEDKLKESKDFNPVILNIKGKSLE